MNDNVIPLSGRKPGSIITAPELYRYHFTRDNGAPFLVNDVEEANILTEARVLILQTLDAKSHYMNIDKFLGWIVEKQ